MKFSIPGEPRGKQRPRVVRSNGFTRTYTPEQTVSYENLVKLEYQRQCGRRFIEEGPVIVRIVANFGIPKSVSKRKREMMLGGKIRPTKKVDCDNIAKIVCDALNALAYRDDAQVVCCHVEKWYAEIPEVIVEIKEA